MPFNACQSPSHEPHEPHEPHESQDAGSHSQHTQKQGCGSESCLSEGGGSCPTVTTVALATGSKSMFCLSRFLVFFRRAHLQHLRHILADVILWCTQLKHMAYIYF